MAQMTEHGIAPIDLLVSNLYPFEATVASGASADDCIENIDIGGPALIRAGAKNHDHVAVVTDPAQYADLLEALPNGGTSLALRRSFAAGRLCPYRRLRLGDRGLVRRPAGHRVPRPLSPYPAACGRPCATAKTPISVPPCTSRGTGPAWRTRGRSRARSCRSTT